MKIFWVTLVWLTITSCKLSPVDDSINNVEKVDPDSGIMMINSASLAEYSTVKKNKIIYKVCKDETDSVIFIRTKSRLFKTSNGVKIGMHLNKFLSKTKGVISEEPGWAFVTSLKDGWCAGFGLTEDGYNMAKDSTVKFIFRRSDFPN